MAQTIRLTLTSELEKALKILRQSTLGTLNTTELIKMAVGSYANIKKFENTSDEKEDKEMALISARQMYEWAKSDGTLEIDNIAKDAKVKPFIPKQYVPNR